MIDGDKATDSLTWVLVYVLLAAIGVLFIATVALSALETFLRLVTLGAVAFIIWAGWRVLK